MCKEFRGEPILISTSLKLKVSKGWRRSKNIIQAVGEDAMGSDNEICLWRQIHPALSWHKGFTLAILRRGEYYIAKPLWRKNKKENEGYRLEKQKIGYKKIGNRKEKKSRILLNSSRPLYPNYGVGFQRRFNNFQLSIRSNCQCKHTYSKKFDTLKCSIPLTLCS